MSSECMQQIEVWQSWNRIRSLVVPSVVSPVQQNAHAIKFACQTVALRTTLCLKKLPLFCFLRITVKREPISIICGIRSLEETLHQKVVNLSTSPEIMSPHYLCEIPNSYFSSISLIGFEYFGYLSIKRTQCQSAAEIITVYLFPRLMLSAYDIKEVSEEKVRAKTDGSEYQVALSVRRRCWTS